VVLPHVVSNVADDVVLVVSSGDESALASNELGHLGLLCVVVTRSCCDYLAKTLATPMPTLRIQICGPVVIERGGDRVEGLLPGRQGRSLFCFLVLNHQRMVPRDELIEALWPTGGPGDPEAALSSLLSRLRRVTSGSQLDGRGTVRLSLDDAVVDLETANAAIHRAESAVAQRQWERAWAASQSSMFTARRGFLPGEDALWIDRVRRHLDELHVRSLETYAAAGLGLGGTELAAARDAGRTLVELAPLRESGHRLLMHALAMEGNTAEVLRAYEHLRLILVDELGIAPSPATRQLYERLLLDNE
jgi:DNA-binding SARP family transcriptional activator